MADLSGSRRPGRIAAFAARRFPGWLGQALLVVAAGLMAWGVSTRLALGLIPGKPSQSRPGGAWGPQGNLETRRLLAVLRQAADDGLDPAQYRVAQIEQELAEANGTTAMAHADRMLSGAALAYARDLRLPRMQFNMTYIDPELEPGAPSEGDVLGAGQPAEKLSDLQALNPLYRELRAGLRSYRLRWSGLPQIAVPPGAQLASGSRGTRVALLRRRLGLPALGAGADRFDESLGEAVRLFRQAHGLVPAAVADQATIAALNEGAIHFENVITLNLDRVRGLPVDGRRYIVVDAAGARLRAIEGGREVDAMRVIVGKPRMETPELAGFVRFAIFNPYWNIPPDLVRQSVAPQVLRVGPSYLAQRRFAVFADWRSTVPDIDPQAVDWKSVAAGQQQVWIRQLPGGDNMMGEVKFMLPNRLGIYLHDTPHKADFAQSDRRLSSGCVRVEDARRLARWIFGSDRLPYGGDFPDRRVDLPAPVPVFITYLTAVGEGGQVRFQKDVYGRDPALLDRRKQLGAISPDASRKAAPALDQE